MVDDLGDQFLDPIVFLLGDISAEAAAGAVDVALLVDNDEQGLQEMPRRRLVQDQLVLVVCRLDALVLENPS
jgi:hypothetical protein